MKLPSGSRPELAAHAAPETSAPTDAVVPAALAQVRSYVFSHGQEDFQEFLQEEGSAALTQACESFVKFGPRLAPDSVSNWDLQFTLESLAKRPQEDHAAILSYMQKMCIGDVASAQWSNVAHIFSAIRLTPADREQFCQLALPLLAKASDYHRDYVLSRLGSQPLTALPSIIDAAQRAPEKYLSSTLIESLAAIESTQKRPLAIESALRTLGDNPFFALGVGVIGKLDEQNLATFEQHYHVLSPLLFNESAHYELVVSLQKVPPQRWPAFVDGIRRCLESVKFEGARSAALIQRLATVGAADFDSVCNAIATLRCGKPADGEWARNDLIPTLMNLNTHEREVRAQAAFALLPPHASEADAALMLRSIGSLPFAQAQSIANAMASAQDVPTATLRQRAWDTAIALMLDGPPLGDAWQSMPLRFMQRYAAQFAPALAARYPDTLQELRQGHFDVSNPKRMFVAGFDFLSQPHALKAASKSEFTWKSVQAQLVRQNAPPHKPLSAQELAEVQFLAYETLRIGSQIIEPAIAHANARDIPLMIVANVTYGGTALSGLVEKLQTDYADQVTHGMRVVFRKQPSTDAHNDANVLSTFFNPSDVEYMAQHEPLTVIIDGVKENDGDMFQPDAFRAFRNFADAMNQTRGTANAAWKQKGLDARRFEPEAQHEELMQQLKALYAGRDSPREPYQFAYGTLTYKPLRTKYSVKDTSDGYTRTKDFETPPAFRFSHFLRSGMVCYQVSMRIQDIEKAAKRGDIFAQRVLRHPDVKNHERRPGYFDDTSHQNIEIFGDSHGAQAQPRLVPSLLAAMAGLQTPHPDEAQPRGFDAVLESCRLLFEPPAGR